MKGSAVLDERAGELARLGIKGWFWEHASTNLLCSCEPGGKPDETCDQGVALHRLSTKANRGHLDEGRPTVEFLRSVAVMSRGA